MAQPAVVNPLEPLFEGWQRRLAMVAHPDDLEFGVAAAIARWTGQGKQIVDGNLSCQNGPLGQMPYPAK
jgi:hypothetical protein